MGTHYRWQLQRNVPSLFSELVSFAGPSAHWLIYFIHQNRRAIPGIESILMIRKCFFFFWIINEAQMSPASTATALRVDTSRRRHVCSALLWLSYFCSVAFESLPIRSRALVHTVAQSTSHPSSLSLSLSLSNRARNGSIIKLYRSRKCNDSQWHNRPTQPSKRNPTTILMKCASSGEREREIM